MKSGFGFRSMKLIGLAAKLGREEVANSIKEKLGKTLEQIDLGRAQTRTEQAKMIVNDLSQLKGAAMKAGQLLSLDAADFLPPEAIELLSKLQGSAEPVPWDVLREVLEEDLGGQKIRDFESLSKTASASASIGQVHKGVLNGRPVAVKIQYPGVRESIDSDLKILKTVAQSFLSVTGRKIDLGEVFAEMAAVLHQEADYLRERDNMREFRRLLEGSPDFFVPEPIDSHCAPRVLTMSWEEGLPISAWLKTNPSMDTRERVGKLVLDLYCREFFDWGFVQTDPNYANFLVRGDGKDVKLVLLDFGAALRYDNEFRRGYIGLLRAMGSKNEKDIFKRFVEMGMLDPREDEEARANFMEMLFSSLEPFNPDRQPFYFGDADYNRNQRAALQKFSQSLRFSPPPRKLIFLHRKLGGIFALLKKMDVKMDLRPYWDLMSRTEIP